MDVFRGDAQVQAATLCGSATLPKTAVAGSSQASVAPLSHHDWKDTNFPWPFWLVQRASTQVECNCVLRTFSARQILTFGYEKHDPLVDTLETRVPVMMNDKAVKKGEELKVFWVGLCTQKRKTQTPKKSWVDAAQVSETKRMKAHAPSKEGSSDV